MIFICGVQTATGTIIVSSGPSITLSSAAGTNNQTICINTALTPITYTSANGVTGVSVTTGTLPAGVTGTFAGGVFTISGTPTVAGTFPYTITTTGGCNTVSLMGTIIINPAVTIALTSAASTTSQTPCINTAITFYDVDMIS